MKEKELTSVCGIFIINVEQGSIAHFFTFEEGDDIKEIYDIEIIPNSCRTTIKQKGSNTVTDFNFIE